MSCALANPKVCLGREDVDGSCVFCVRKFFRDGYRSGALTFEEFRLMVAAETNEAAK